MPRVRYTKKVDQTPRKITYTGPPGTKYQYGKNELNSGESVVVESYTGHWVELVKSGNATCE